jgi:hypothetical protein
VAESYTNQSANHQSKYQANRKPKHQVNHRINRQANQNRRISKKPWKKLLNSGRYYTHCHIRSYTVSDYWYLYPSSRPAD